jgi:hypothetical protein
MKGHPGIIDQNIDPVPLPESVCRRGFHRPVIRDIKGMIPRLVALFVDLVSLNSQPGGR